VTAPHLSLIAPAWNGAHYITGNVQAMVSALERMGRPFEIIVVCDGCTDGTPEAVEAVGDDRVKVLAYSPNYGKGHAICHGIEHASGRLVGWLDPDLDIDPEAIILAVAAFDERPIDAVVGSKRHRDSRVAYPMIRRLYSWGFQMLVRILFRINVRDTQVGAKVFRREMIDTVAPLLLVKRWAFDLEVLAVGAEFGFDRIEEIPIGLDYRFTGSSISWRAVRLMFQDTLAIAYRIHLRHWYVRRFAALQRHRMDDVAAATGRFRAPEMAHEPDPRELAPSR
jgi:glycosyltransferase involved in cell wall biosynthesis